MPESDNVSGSSGYDFQEECEHNGIYYVYVLTTNCVGITQNGSDLIVYHIVLGASILCAYIISDMLKIFFHNKYRFGGNCDSTKNCCRNTGGIIVVIGQTIINIIVGIACGIAIAATCFNIGGMIIIAVEAFFVLELDDLLVPVFHCCCRYQGHKRKDELGNKDTIERRIIRPACQKLYDASIKSGDCCEPEVIYDHCSSCAALALWIFVIVFMFIPIFFCCGAIHHLLYNDVLKKISVCVDPEDYKFIFPFFSL